VVSSQDERVWIRGSRVECRGGGVEVNIMKVFVEVDATGCMLGGSGEREHEVGVGA
jgi:hypothetical protein